MLINLIVIIALLLSYLSNYISPAKWAFPAFFGITYPIILLINIFFVILWLLLWKKYLFLSLIVILSGAGFIGKYLQFNKQEEIPDKNKVLKILTFNVHNLTENNFKKLDQKQNQIFEYLVEQYADITCLQEFFSFGENYYYPLVFLQRKLNADNYYFQSYYNPYSEKIVGMAIFSKLKRINSGTLFHDSTRNFGIYGDYIFINDTFRVYNIHLESLYLGKDDYDMITGNQLNKIDRKKSSELMSKLNIAFRNRAMQVNSIAEHMNTSPYPVILCGDFNDIPTSYAYHRLTSGLKDAFVERGYGMNKTFRGKLPYFRIDYICYDPVFKAKKFNSTAVGISDHFPVSCYLEKTN